MCDHARKLFPPSSKKYFWGSNTSRKRGHRFVRLYLPSNTDSSRPHCESLGVKVASRHPAGFVPKVFKQPFIQSRRPSPIGDPTRLTVSSLTKGNIISFADRPHCAALRCPHSAHSFQDALCLPTAEVVEPSAVHAHSEASRDTEEPTQGICARRTRVHHAYIPAYTGRGQSWQSSPTRTIWKSTRGVSDGAGRDDAQEGLFRNYQGEQDTVRREARYGPLIPSQR